MAEADKARAEAEATNLPRVQEPLLQSAQAWEAQAAIARRFAHLQSQKVAAQDSDTPNSLARACELRLPTRPVRVKNYMSKGVALRGSAPRVGRHGLGNCQPWRKR
jgi:hypothetical protein